jgi:DNA repair protein RadC
MATQLMHERKSKAFSILDKGEDGKAIYMIDPMKLGDSIHALFSNIHDLEQEAFVCVPLTTQLEVLDVYLVGLGTVDAVMCHAREAFRPAIMDAAHTVILAHNHPGGNPEPSKQDLQISRVLFLAGLILDIPVLDCLVIGRQNHPKYPAYYSLRENGYLDADAPKMQAAFMKLAGIK